MLTALLELDHENDYIFFLDSLAATASDIPARAEQVIIELSESPTQAASADSRRGIGDMIRMGRAVSAANLDVFFFPSVYTYFPVWGRFRKIVAIHDVIAEKYPELIFKSWKNRLFWTLKTWLAIRQSDRVLTVSQFSKQGIIEHFRLPDAHVGVVTEGSADSFGPVDDRSRVNAAMVAHGLAPDTRYILYVGGIAPHKNLAVLARAFSQLIAQPGYADVRLVLVGDFENDVFLIDEQLRSDMNNPQFREKVIFTGYVTDDDLNCLYNGAKVFVLPSFCEGFGLPALEAMACGTVVIGSDTTSVPEVVGDAGLFFDPYNADELQAHLRVLLDDDDLRERLGRRSLERAATFSWQQSARDSLAIFTAAAR
jgi:glycosyltransferase involved in cell wall biosynthesis